MSLVNHLLDLLASIVVLISACDQVCNVSQFASVPEGSRGFMIMMKVSKKIALIYFMVIKKKELADVILVNIYFRTLLLSLLIFAFVFKINLFCVYLEFIFWAFSERKKIR